MSDESAGTGYTAADTLDPVEFMRMQHRAGKHAGRFRNADCQECYPPAQLATEDTPRAEWGSSTPPTGNTALRPEDNSDVEIARLWEELNKGELARVLPKAFEYGARDLEVFGGMLRLLFGVPDRISNQEIAVTVYTLGKVSRVIGAMADGRPGSEDSWHDTGVYAKMAQIIRKRGRWM